MKNNAKYFSFIKLLFGNTLFLNARINGTEIKIEHKQHPQINNECNKDVLSKMDNKTILKDKTNSAQLLFVVIRIRASKKVVIQI